MYVWNDSLSIQMAEEEFLRGFCLSQGFSVIKRCVGTHPKKLDIFNNTSHSFLNQYWMNDLLILRCKRKIIRSFVACYTKDSLSFVLLGDHWSYTQETQIKDGPKVAYTVNKLVWVKIQIYVSYAKTLNFNHVIYLFIY